MVLINCDTNSKVNTKLRRSNMVSVLFLLLLFLVGLISKCGKLIIGMDVDEQYSISLAYRIASGDAMLAEMWEPHQTSALLPAFFLKVYMSITGGTTYSVIFLRLVGGILQGIISLFWFATFKKEYGNSRALLSATLLFTVLPKWIQSPEFANQEIWWLSLTLIFIYRGLGGHICNWIGAGIALSLCVLAYPSSAIVFLTVCVFFAVKRRIKEVIALVSTCAVCGAVVLTGICSMSSMGKVLSSIKYALTDSSHAEKLGDKLIGYIGDSVEIFSFMAAYFTISILVVFLVAKLRKDKVTIGHVVEMMLLISIIDQYRLWMLEEYANPHPSVHFVVVFVLFCLMLVRKGEKTDFDLILFISSLSGFLAVVLISNLDLKASIVHLFPAFLGYILLSDNNEKLDSFIRYSWLLGVVTSYAILVRFNGGYHKDLLMAKQKALYGPAKGIYCEYMDGYIYNSNAELIEANISRGEDTFLLGDNDLLYMISNSRVCSASIISTPIFDEKYIEYFDASGRMPSKIIVEKSFLNHKEEDYSLLCDWMKDKYYQVDENEYITIWKSAND